MSVPHSGTRTLVELLALGRLPGGRRWWHFGNREHAARLRRFPGRVHIPLRDPWDVAASWARRPMTGQPLRALLASYAAMMEFLDRAAERCELHVMEFLPRLAGADELPGAEPPSGRLRAYREALLEHVLGPHRPFWARFYAGDRWRSTPTSS